MTNLLKLGKKIFTVGVVSTTIFWSLGVAALVPAVASAATEVDCAALKAGDMIKTATGSDIWVLNADKSISYFSDGDLYKSWTADKNYSYNLVSNTCAKSFSPAGAVYPRPGTYLVKTGLTDTVYAVLPGMKLAEMSADVAKALYGAKYALSVPKGGRTITIDNASWLNFSKTVVTTKVTEVAPTEGALVKSGTKYYVVGAGMTLKEVTATGLIANKFQKALALNLTATTGYTVSTESFDAQDAMLSDITQGAKGTGTPAPGVTVVSGNLNVALSAGTPSAGNVVTAVDNVAFTKVNLTAASNDVMISSFTIGRRGLGQPSDFNSVTLYDGGTKIGSTRTSFDSNNQIVYNIPNGLKIAAGTTKEVTVVGNLGTAGKYNALGIDAIGAGTGTVAGLPVYGNEMFGVSVNVGTVTITNQGTDATKNIGTTDVTLAQFRLAVGSVENGTFNRITLKNKAATNNASDGDVTNLVLYKGTQKLAGPVSMVSDKITFVLDTPVGIDKSKNEEFKVVGDVVDGNANHVEFVLDNTTDLEVRGATYKTALTVAATSYDAAGEGMNLTIGGAQLNIAYTGTAVDTQADKTGVTFGTITLSAGGTDAKITNLVLTVAKADGNGTVLDNKDVDNFQLIENNGGAYSGTMTGGTDTSVTSEVWTFSDEIYLSKGVTRTFVVKGDLPAGIGSGDSYKLTLAVGTGTVTAETVPAGDSVSTFSIGSIDGKYVTVKAPYITVRPVGQNDVNGVVNQQNLVMYKTTVEATAGPVTISRMKFEGANAAAANTSTVAANLDKDNFSDFGLYVLKADGTYELLQNITHGNMTDGVADFDSFSKTVEVGSGNKVTFVFKGTVASTLDGSNHTVHVQLNTVTAKDADNNTAAVLNASGTAVANNTQLETTGSTTLGATGLLYVSMRNADTGFDKNRVALAGSSYWVGKLRLRADFESITVKDLKLQNANTNSDDSVDSVCLYKSQSTAADQLVACSSMDTAGVVFFPSMNHLVNQGTEDLFVYVTTRPMGNLANATADTVDAIQFSISTSSANNFTATGEASGTDLAFGNLNGTASAGEIVFDKNLDGTFDATATDNGGTASTKTFTVAGSRPSKVEMVNSWSGYTVDTKINGTGDYTAAIFAVTNESNSNTDSSGNPLDLTLAALNFDLTKAASTTFSGATVQRINGAVAAQALSLGASSTNANAGAAYDTWTMAAASSTLGADAKIAAGQTAYYVVKATVSALNTADVGTAVDWFKVSLNNLTNADSAATNISWYDGYSVPTNLFRYLQLDTTSIAGVKISE